MLSTRHIRVPFFNARMSEFDDFSLDTDFVRIETCGLQILQNLSGLRNSIFGPLAEAKKKWALAVILLFSLWADYIEPLFRN